MSLTKRIFRAPEVRAGTPFGIEDLIPAPGAMEAMTAAGVPVNDDTAMRLGVVFACVRIIANSVAGLPLDAVKMRGTYREQLDPAPLIISDPFGGANKIAGVTRRIGISAMMVSLLLRGNAFALITARDYRGYPARLTILDPDNVVVDIDDNGYRTYTLNNQLVPDGDMFHVPGLSMPGAPSGISVIGAIRNAVGLGLAAELFGLKFFGSGAHLSGVIEIEQDLDPERARELKNAFSSSHAGMANAHAIGVLSGGATFKPISVTPEDAQFLGTRAAQNIDIAMVFGVPPHMLGQVDRTTSWGKGIEEQKLGFLNFTVSDWTGRLEDAWSAMLPKPQVAKFNLDAFLRADTSTRYSSYSAARTVSLMTPNEIRALEDMPPIDGGDDLFAPLNSAHTVSTMTSTDDDDLHDEGEPPIDNPANPAPKPKPKKPAVAPAPKKPVKKELTP